MGWPTLRWPEVQEDLKTWYEAEGVVTGPWGQGPLHTQLAHQDSGIEEEVGGREQARRLDLSRTPALSWAPRQLAKLKGAFHLPRSPEVVEPVLCLTNRPRAGRLRGGSKYNIGAQAPSLGSGFVMTRLLAFSNQMEIDERPDEKFRQKLYWGTATAGVKRGETGFVPYLG